MQSDAIDIPSHQHVRDTERRAYMRVGFVGLAHCRDGHSIKAHGSIVRRPGQEASSESDGAVTETLRHWSEIRAAGSPAEERAAGEVTAAAYEEFRPFFAPDDWRVYAATLPETARRVDEGELLVAVDERSEVVGTVTLYLEPKPSSGHWREDDAVFRFLAVRPDRRGDGVGSALLDHCICRARLAGKRRLALQTTPPMTVAVRMYEQKGFHRDSTGDMVAGSFVLQGYAKRLDG